MATAHVQTKDAQSSGGTTIAVTLTGVGAGNHMVCWTAEGAGTGSTIGTTTSSPVATWTAVDTQINNGTAAGGRFYYSENVASGSWTVTAHTGTSTAVTACVGEASGIATSSSLDGTLHGTAANSGAATTVVNPTLTGVPVGDLIWTGTSDNGAGTTADTINQSFVVSSDATAWNGANMRAGVAHLDNVAAGNYNPTWTLPSSVAGITAIAAFKSAVSDPFPAAYQGWWRRPQNWRTMLARFTRRFFGAIRSVEGACA